MEAAASTTATPTTAAPSSASRAWNDFIDELDGVNDVELAHRIYVHALSLWMLATAAPGSAARTTVPIWPGTAASTTAASTTVARDE